jgi:hypothetical protein
MLLGALNRTASPDKAAVTVAVDVCTCWFGLRLCCATSGSAAKLSSARITNSENM